MGDIYKTKHQTSLAWKKPPQTLFVLFNVRQMLLGTAGEASCEARPEGVPPEYVEQHQNQKHQQRENQQEEDEQAVSEGVVWGKTGP